MNYLIALTLAAPVVLVLALLLAAWAKAKLRDGDQ